MNIMCFEIKPALCIMYMHTLLALQYTAVAAICCYDTLSTSEALKAAAVSFAQPHNKATVLWFWVIVPVCVPFLAFYTSVGCLFHYSFSFAKLVFYHFSWWMSVLFIFYNLVAFVGFVSRIFSSLCMLCVCCALVVLLTVPCVLSLCFTYFFCTLILLSFSECLLFMVL